MPRTEITDCAHLTTIIADGLGDNYAAVIDRSEIDHDPDFMTLWVDSGRYRYKITVEVADEH
jgi:hypothetical protein